MRRYIPALGALLLVVALAGCSRLEPTDGPPLYGSDRPLAPDPTPRVEPRSRYGNPASYVVNGQRYYTLDSSEGYVERGLASWYGRKFHGRRTSSGETYDMHLMTAAHKSLPLPTYVHVTNLKTGNRVVVRVNDRGPFHGNRVIDLSYAAARKLGIVGDGTGLVEVRAIDPRRPQSTTVAARPTPATSRDLRLYLQAGAFSERNNAERLRARILSMTSAPVTVYDAKLNGRRMYRVWLGPLAGVPDADSLSNLLVSAGLDLPRIVIE